MAQRWSMLRMLRTGLLALLLLAVAALTWFAVSEPALHWTVARLEAQSNGRLRVEAPSGSLLGPVSAARIVVRDGAMSLRVEGPAVTIGWAALLRGVVRVRSLSATALRIDLPVSAAGPAPAPSPPSPPVALGLPVRLEIDRFVLDRLTIHQGGTQTVITGMAGAFTADGTSHRLRLDRLEVAGTRIKGALAIGALAPFKLEGMVEVARDTGLGPLRAGARVQGTLSKVELALDAALAKNAARGTAIIAPFDADWLASARLDASGIDAAVLRPGAPTTDLRVHLRAQGGARGVLTGAAELDNTSAGPLSANRLPLAAMQTQFRLEGSTLHLNELRAALPGGGRLNGGGVIDGVRSRWTLALEALDLKAIHATLHPTRLAGTLEAEASDAVQRIRVAVNDADIALNGEARFADGTLQVESLQVTGRGGELRGTGSVGFTGPQRFSADLIARGLDPANFGEWPRAHLNGSVVATGQLKPSPQASVTIELANSHFRNALLDGRARFDVTRRSIRALAADVRIGANRLRAEGDFGREGDALTLRLEAGNLAQLDRRLAGRLAGEATLMGSLQRAGGQIALRGRGLTALRHYRAGQLALTASVSSDVDRHLSIDLDLGAVRTPQGALDALRVGGAGRLSAHEITAEARNAHLNAKLQLAGGLLEGRGWRGTLREFFNEGATPARLQAPTTLEVAPGRLLLGAAELRVLEGVFSLQSLRWEQGQLATTGQMRALPAAPLLALAGIALDRATDLRLKGDWAIRASPRLNGSLRIERDAGDVVLATAPRFAAGLSSVSLEARFAEDAIEIDAQVQATRVGEARLRAQVAPGPEPGRVSLQAGLRGTIEARIPTLSPVHAFVGSGVVIDGRADATLALGGTLEAPTLSGVASMSGVRVDMPQQALALFDGQAQLKLDGQSLSVESMSIRGPQGIVRASGSLRRDNGDGRLAWRAEGLRLLNRPDRELVVSGAGVIETKAARIAMRGELRADRGLIEVRRAAADRLGEDVVIVGRETAAAPDASPALPLDLDMTLDVGEQFRVHLLGLETGLHGRVRVRSGEDGAIRAKGTIETRGGTYRAFGQSLVIERGRLGFDGPIDNPVLDVLALRKNQAVEAGVQVTGALRSPSVRLTSNPAVPDHEKLSWLLLGQGAANAQGADAAMLQAAASALSGPESEAPLTQRIARDLGLDEVGIRSRVGGQVVALGKRLSDRLYFEFEQGLTVAATLVRLKFLLTQTLSLRVEASPQGSGVGIGYGRSYD